MSCDDARSLLELEPLDLLAPDERAALDAHTAACPACALERDRLRAAHAALTADAALALARPVPVEARERALAAADAGGAGIGTTTGEEAGVGKKGTLIEGPTVDAARVEAVGRRIALGCSYCHARTARDEVVFCASCLAPHHAECFRTHGRCSLPGCEETATVRPGAARATTPPRRRGIRLGFVVGLAVVGGVAAWRYDERELQDRIAREAGLEQALAVRDGQLAVLARRAAGAARVSLDVKDVDLKDAVEQLASQTGQSVLVDQGIDEKVSLSLRDVPFEDALAALARKARCKVEALGERLWSVTQPPKVTLQFTDASVRTVLQLLVAYSGKNILIGPEVRGLVTQDFKEVDWDLALVMIAHSARARAWVVGEDLIYVGETPPPGATAFEPGVRKPLAVAREERADAAPIDLDLKDATPAEACARVAAAADRTIELLGAPDPDRRVTLRLRAVPWPDALSLVAQAAGCDVEPAALGAIVRPVPRLSLVRSHPVRLRAVVSLVVGIERAAGRSFDVAIPPDVGERMVAVELVDVRPREALVAWALAAGCELSGDSPGPMIAAVTTGTTVRAGTSAGRQRPSYAKVDPQVEAVALGPGYARAVLDDRTYEVGQALVDPDSEEELEGTEILSITKDCVRVRFRTGERSFEAPPPPRRR